jgi:hypothetical protein
MRVAAKVSHQCIDGEVIVIDLESGSYYSLLGMAAQLWNLALSVPARADLLERVHSVYGPDAVPPVAAFVEELVRECLLIDEPGPYSAVAVELPHLFTVPAIEKFTDMQDLLMLDPIHEVDAAGWPHRPVES